MIVPIYQVDAFCGKVFGGNPAAVCVLGNWPVDDLLLSVARENNLSETSFLIERGEGWDIRWFTPAGEIDLAGHPTLAAAWVIFEILRPGLREVRFKTRQAGDLFVRMAGSRLSMDFPSRPGDPVDPPVGLAEALGAAPEATYLSRDLMAVFPDRDTVAALDPDFRALSAVDGAGMGIIVTAPGDTDEAADFVSRFFAPGAGIDEDPVTGSAHCTLTPYWAERLGKKSLYARQISRRGGELFLEDRGERVTIAGEAALFMEGRIYV